MESDESVLPEPEPDTPIVVDFPEDRFKPYRKGGTHLVGIAMNVTWVQEAPPSPESPDSPDKDRSAGVLYRYDLELDSDGCLLARVGRHGPITAPA